MSHIRTLILGASALILAACSSGNLRGTQAHSGPTPSPVRDRYFEPYMTPGEAQVTWVAPLQDRAGTIVRPRDPVIEQGLYDYASAPWLVRRNAATPPGTY